VEVGAGNASERSGCDEEKCPGPERVKVKHQIGKKQNKTVFLTHFHNSEVNEKRPSLQ